MGKLEDNVLVHGLRGMVGDLLVFRVVDGKTVVGKKPSTANRTYSPKQLDQQEVFQDAIIYGKKIASTPELAEEYLKMKPKNKSVYQTAVSDFLKAPKIKEVDVTEYNGEKGSNIRIRATDNFYVKNIGVTIFDKAGAAIEKGNAVRSDNEKDWFYAATKANANLEGVKILVTATDIPGNISSAEVIL